MSDKYQIIKEQPYKCNKCDRFSWFTSLMETKYCHACFSLWLSENFPVLKDEK